MDKINKLSLPATILIASIILGGFFYASQINKQRSIVRQQEIKSQASGVSETKKETSATFKTYDEGALSDDLVNCEFKVLSSFIYKNQKDSLSDVGRKVVYETVEQETPVLLTFAGLSTENPMMKGNNGDSQLIKVKDDNESIVLAEKNSFGELFFYTIFKKEKVAVWSKTYKLLSMPYAHLSMGYCY